MRRLVILVDLGIQIPNALSLALAEHPGYELVATIRDQTITVGNALEHMPSAEEEFIDFVMPRLDRIQASEAIVGIFGKSQNSAARFYVNYFVERGMPVTICEKVALAAAINEDAIERKAAFKMLDGFRERALR